MTAAATGLTGKLPAHGDFVRRRLPRSFTTPWEAWLDAAMACARPALPEPEWQALWAGATAWRFHLAGGTFGGAPVAGVLLPSRDAVGRRYPLTLAAPLAPEARPEPAWFAHLEELGLAAVAGRLDADGLADALPPVRALPDPVACAAGWWRDEGPAWPPGLPSESLLLRLFGPEGAA